jgi:hypothetical protein
MGSFETGHLIVDEADETREKGDQRDEEIRRNFHAGDKE